LQPAYRDRLATGPLGLRVTERAAQQTLSLPMYPQLCEEMTDRVIAEINGFFSQTLCSEAEADGPR